MSLGRQATQQATQQAAKQAAQQAHQQGVQQQALASAQKMLRKNLSIDEIIEFTGLSREVVLKLIQTNKNEH